MSVGEQRAQLQSAVTNLVQEAQAEGHLNREVSVTIDTTTGPRFWGDRADHEDTILGTKAADRQYAYHYATLQFVDEDAPIILNARPVECGESRDEIVAYLTPRRRTGEQGRLERLAASGVDVFREPHGSFAERTREVLYERADTGDVETTISADETEQMRQSELWDELEATLDMDIHESDRDEREAWSGLGDILNEDDQQDSDDEQVSSTRCGGS